MIHSKPFVALSLSMNHVAKVCRYRFVASSVATLLCPPLRSNVGFKHSRHVDEKVEIKGEEGEGDEVKICEVKEDSEL